jgi:NTE family protein
MDITLALGGGGSRGYAHVGVIRRLEKEGYRIRALAGTSAGGIVAAMYAAGYSPDEIEALFEKIDQTKLFTFSFTDAAGLLSVVNATRILEGFFGERTFEDLKIPCSLVAVDVKKPQEVVLHRGRLVDAVLATCAIPGVFPTRQIENYDLVDGGVLDPVPVSVARALAPHVLTVAVVLSKPLEEPGRFTHIPLPVKVPTPIIERITRMRMAQILKVFMESVDIGQRMITELRLEADKPDVIVRPDVGEIGLLDRVDVAHVISLGEDALVKVLPELSRASSWSRQMGRQLFPTTPGRVKNDRRL